MSSRLRSLDSKISFFAFADIITAVSGVLIFVALLLATDLGRPTSSKTPSASAATEQQLQNTLAQQAALDEENQRLEDLLATAETAPDPAKLQADIARLRAGLAQAQQKQATLTNQMTASQAAMAERDRVLGLTGLKADIQRVLHEIEAIGLREAATRTNANDLEEAVARVESQLLKLRQREGQIWLIPEQSTTTKEPILITVSGDGLTIEQFDHPERRQQLGNTGVNGAFKDYLSTANPKNQYVVFLIRPSGIGTFENLVNVARGEGFEVGYDALEETRQVHFSMPPPIEDNPPPPAARPGGQSPGGGNGNGGGRNSGSSGGSGSMTGGMPGTGAGNSNAGAAGTPGNSGGNGSSPTPGQGTRPADATNAAPAAAPANSPTPPPSATSAAPPVPELSWWQRLIAWVKSKL